MRLKVQFGLIDSREVEWWQPIEDFPTIIKFLGKNYEWVVYSKDLTGKVDIVMTFSELPSYDLNYGVLCPVWEDMFGTNRTKKECECGAAFGSFSWDHMRMCKLWKPWSKL